MFTIEIDTGNAAFHDPNGEGLDSMYEAIELKRILMGVCRKLDGGYTAGKLVDSNGNVVGGWCR